MRLSTTFCPGWVAAVSLVLLVLLGPRPATSGPAIYYIHNDHLGTPRVVTDQLRDVKWRADYRPFGEAILHAEDIEMPLRMPGQYYDSETGLHYNYFRDYDPGLGRYIQSDPIGLAGGLNTYNYAYMNPLAGIDPYGLLTVGEANAIGAVVGGAIGGAVNGALSGAMAGSAVPGAGTFAGTIAGAAGGALQGGSTGALASAANTTLGAGGSTLVGLVSGGLGAAGAALAAETVRLMIPSPSGSLAAGAIGGALGGASTGPAFAVGSALGGAIGGALATALCYGDDECRAELNKRENQCE